MDKPASLRCAQKLQPELIYFRPGFLAGPYENRAGLDETAQMMGGLLIRDRSVTWRGRIRQRRDGRHAAAIAILAAAWSARRPAAPVCEGALFENRVPDGPAYDRRLQDGRRQRPIESAWAVYDTFRTSDGVWSSSGWSPTRNGRFRRVRARRSPRRSGIETNPQRVEARLHLIVTALFGK